MKPALLSFPHVSSYPVLLLLGIFCGWILARKLARSKGIQGRHIDNIALLIPLLGLGGARFFARLFYAKLPIAEALQIWKGDGLVFYGGFIFCAAGIVIYALLAKIPVLRLLDALAPSAALGLAFGRVGCFLAGCCWGDWCVAPATLAGLSPERMQQVQTFPALSPPNLFTAVQFPPRSDVYKVQVKWGLLEGTEERSQKVHPVQLYEASLAMLLAIALWRVARGKYREGDLAVALLLSYAAIRFVTEYFRGDNKLAASGFTVSQELSIYICIFSLLYLLAQSCLRMLVNRREQKVPAAAINSSTC